MDIEVIESNEYIRTEKGHISKNLTTILWIAKDTTINGDLVVKHGKSIIDIIEIGDIVNGYKVISVDYDVIDNNADCIELDLNNNYQYNFISVNQIKTILTHEEYERRCYRLEG